MIKLILCPNGNLYLRNWSNNGDYLLIGSRCVRSLAPAQKKYIVSEYIMIMGSVIHALYLNSPTNVGSMFHEKVSLIVWLIKRQPMRIPICIKV